MRKIRDVLRYRHNAGLSLDAIARALKISKGVVAKYLRLADDAGLVWPLPDDLDDRALEQRLRAPIPPKPATYTPPDFAHVHQEMKRGGMTLLLLWEEYRLGAEGRCYQYTSFCTHYRDWAKKLQLSMRQVHLAGEKLFADYAGQTVPLVDPRTGEIHAASIFVAALGASNYTFACATLGQTKHDWLQSIEKALRFIGGVTAMIVPDNPKAMVTVACPFEPGINRSAVEFADYYGTVILPARPGKPKDKAKVEGAVLVVERWILARLRNRTFFSLHELNEAIAPLLDDLNSRPFKKLPGCRKAAYLSLDKPALRPLPSEPYDHADWGQARVNIDYHVAFEDAYYSVPHQLVRQKVDLRVSAGTIEVFAQGKRVASHLRATARGVYKTLPEHMPAAHRSHAEWSPQKLIHWGNTIGPATGQLISEILTRNKHPEQGYRTCLGLKRLARKYPHQRVETACARALKIGSPRYSTVSNILKAGLDQQPLPEMDEKVIVLNHANIRGSGYYQKKA